MKMTRQQSLLINRNDKRVICPAYDSDAYGLLRCRKDLPSVLRVQLPLYLDGPTFAVWRMSEFMKELRRCVPLTLSDLPLGVQAIWCRIEPTYSWWI